jgi:hypothetical protein
LLDIIVMEHFPGYTRAALRAESADFVEKLRMYVQEKNRVAADEIKRMKR